MKKRFLFTLMALCLCLCLLPTAAVAEETCTHTGDGFDAATGKCDDCGYQYPVKVYNVNSETTSWYTAFEPNRWSGDNLEVTLFGDAEGNLRSSENISFLKIDLNGHTLDGSLNFVAAYTPMSGTLTNNSSKTNGGTITGAVTVSGVTYANTLTISGDVTVKGKVTVQSNGVLTLEAGVTLAGGIDASLASKNVADCLASNTVLAKKDADGSYTALVAGKQMQIDSTAADPLKVIAHTSHTFTDGKCGCGYSCPHAQGFNATTGKCVDCGKQKAVKLSNSAGNVSWYQSVSEAYDMTQTDASSSFQITLFGDVTAEAGIFFNQNKTFELDLNGHKLAFATPGNNDNIIVSSGTLNIRNSDSSKQSEIVGGVMVEDGGWATLGAGLTITVQLRLNAASVFDVLADGAAYVDSEGNVIQKTDTHVSLLEPAKTIAHTHTYDATTGKCACGVQRVATVEINGKTTDLTSLSSLNTLIAGKTATVTLLADATGVISVSSGTITLDLKGKTLTGPLTVSGGNVTVNANGGKIIGAVSLTNDYLTLNGGTYNGTVTASGGTLSITGGTFNGTVDLGSNGSASLSGGSFNALKAGKNLMDYLAENRAFATAENGSVGESVTKNLKNVKVIEHYSTDHIDKDAPFSQCDFCGKDLAAYITKADSSKQYFESLASALENVKNGETVTLLSLTALTSDTTISGKSFTFDLSNKEICGSVQYGTGTLIIADGAGLTLKGATNSKLIVPVKVNGTLTVDSAVTLDNVSVESGGHITVNADAKFSSLSITGGTATLKSGTFTTLEVGSSETIKSKNFLGTGCGYYDTANSKWLTDADLGGHSLSGVSVKAVPIKSVSLEGSLSVTYGNGVSITADVETADGVTATPTYKWTLNGDDLNSNLPFYNDTSFKVLGEQTFVCEATIDGYTVSATHKVTVRRAVLPSGAAVTLTHEDVALRVGDTLTAVVSGLPEGETLSDETTYTYYVGGVEVEGETGSTLTVPSGSVGKTITVDVHIVTEHYTHDLDGKITSNPTTAVRKPMPTSNPTAPTDFTTTANSITVTTAAGQEYAISTTNTAPTSGWVTPANGKVTFEALAANTTYYIFYRVAETEEAEAGAAQSVSKTTAKASIPDNAIGTLAGYTGTYDCAEHDAVVGSAAVGYIIAGYKTSEDGNVTTTMPKVKNVGSTELWVVLSRENYENRTFKLTAASIAAKTLTDDMIVLDASQNAYDGKEQSVKFTVKDGTTGLTLSSDYTVTSGDTATDVGDKTLTIAGVGNYTGTVTKEWSLQKRTPAAADFTINGLAETTYNGTAKAVTAALKSPMTGAGALTVYYAGSGNTTYAKSTTAPTDAGTYAVTLDVAEGTNFEATSGLSLGTLTIKQTSQSVTAQGSNIVRGNTLDLSELVTVTGVSGGSATGALSYSPVVTLPDGVTLNGSTLKVSKDVTVNTKIDIFIIAAATQNYKEGKTQIRLTVKDKYDAVVTISNAPASTAYGDSFTLTASVGGGLTGGTWSWESSDSNILAITDGANSATVTVTAKRVTENSISYRPASLRVTYSSDTHYGTKETSDIPVTKKALTITGVTAIDRDYNGYTTVELTGGELVGVVGSDNVSFFLDAGTAESANAGTQKVTTDITLNGEMEGNYTLTQPDDITVTIRKINPSYTVPTGLTATYGQTLADVDLTGHTGWSWADATRSVGDASDTAKNFKAVFTPDDTTNYNVMRDIDVPVTVGKADPAVPTGLAGLKGNALSTVTLPTGWSWDDDTTVMDETKEYTASYAGSTNYNAKSAVGVTVTVSDKQPQALSVTMDGWTYGEAANEPQYTMPEGAAKLTTQYKVKGAADSTYASDVPTGAGEYTVRVSYETATEIWSGSADFTIAKVTPTGEPKYTAITASGKKLSDANLTTVDGTFSVAGSVKWIDAEGNDLADTTEVAANTAYKWLFTPTDSGNYNAITGSVTLWVRSSGGGGGSSASTTITVPVSSKSGSVNVKAEVSKTGTATVEISDKQIEKVASDGAGTVTIDVSGLKNVESAKIPSHVVETTNKAADTGLTVALPTGSVALDETALGSISSGRDVTVSVKRVPATDLNEAQQKAVGDMANIGLVIDVDLLVGGKKQSNFNGGKLTISVPYTPKRGEDTSKLTVWFIRDDGTIENMGGYYDAEKKCFVFETTHLSRYLLVRVDEQFSDVAADAYYAAAVNWAVAQNITNGIGDGKFGPDLGCTRAQIVTFLYRCAVAQGVDVSAGEDTNILSYADALEVPEYAVEAFQWAVGAGIIRGADGKLLPNDDCTRAQIVTMLYRYAVSVGKDVSIGEETNILSYADAFEVPEYAVNGFQWACGAGIIQGADGKLLPNDTCTRGQIVTMLYRANGK